MSERPKTERPHRTAGLLGRAVEVSREIRTREERAYPPVEDESANRVEAENISDPVETATKPKAFHPDSMRRLYKATYDRFFSELLQQGRPVSITPRDQLSA